MSIDALTLPRPSQLWKSLPPDRKLAASGAFWQDEGAMAEQGEAIALIAQRIKFRAKSVMTLSPDSKARHLAALGAPSEAVAARLLVSYHLERQRPMMGRFLDLLGIAHEDGLIRAEDPEAPPVDRLREAARALVAEHPREDVSLYFSTLLWQDPETWGELANVPERTI